MASITIRRLDESVKERLKKRAARHGVSMEEEARELLKVGVNTQDSGQAMVDSIRRLVAPVGGIEFPDVRRELARDPPTFD
jgi:plasmid stability protein